MAHISNSKAHGRDALPKGQFEPVETQVLTAIGRISKECLPKKGSFNLCRIIKDRLSKSTHTKSLTKIDVAILLQKNFSSIEDLLDCLSREKIVSNVAVTIMNIYLGANLLSETTTPAASNSLLDITDKQVDDLLRHLPGEERGQFIRLAFRDFDHFLNYTQSDSCTLNKYHIAGAVGDAQDGSEKWSTKQATDALQTLASKGDSNDMLFDIRF